jgi:4-amino-4-deoxy-L-arabinose transferase-like glycosyltransferase
MTLSRMHIVLAGLGAAILTVIALAVANFAGDGDNGGVPEYVVTLGGALAVVAALFGWIIPRSQRPARAGLVAGLVGVLSLPVFWTGLPFVLGPAAAALGLLGISRDGRRAEATAVVAVGALVTLAGIAGLVLDGAA